MKAIGTLLILLFCITIVKGQANWTLVSQPGTNLIIVNETTGYTSISKSVGSHGSKYTLSKSTDGFHSFVDIRSKIGDFGGYSLGQMFYIDSDLVFITEYYQGLAKIYKTIDGGQSWSTTGGGTGGLSMYFLNENFGYYSFRPVHDSYLVRHNSNLIESGPIVYTSNKYIFTNVGSDYITKMKFLNDSLGFIICKDSLNNAVILKTSNYGSNWDEVKVLENNLFRDIFFISDSVGLVIGADGIILRSDDMGENWQPISSNSSNRLNSIDFADDGAGCIVGNHGTILKSYDLGLSWTEESFIDTADLVYVRLFENEKTYINNHKGKLYSKNFPFDNTGNSPDEILIYPNPSNNILNISLPENIQLYAITVYNLQGEKIFVSDQNKINLSEFVSGVYLLEIETSEGISRKKILKE